ncbi:3-phosphoserine/phosphohydroxythreonine transaminase [Lactiplantibacillus mudanjiangensis]|uniref:Phosphoserine aminotransferase n=1 Tax=Lactiplantibacillus mudanjiangensis TaxID=1296538 RepID=A0A660E835_9LACO|nr:3-phosphoserine/phosphohydroxythreonine transaminase [Lactiplantibacillus mudanjiangensis]VDG21164.1 3-phosphoserine/phosphohydroxythreonine transaminase [Lactobacillus sp.] [Lactiplantibacillus mudanjiangensis]VDG22899.1 3-phosphoserine/phosphohydroxythreonine transaminase [Lactobacillus sp.] [Lactiplantibacillus mudanjiangensis]VDG29241.1 3-phosphoserine/phosphohydroxythreonine transaminase [Lactobacillus sp.] [Lactiplantibacillus mudanjiangensis]VDG31767.1 3-phosphoserine/phosphohydroxyth
MTTYNFSAGPAVMPQPVIQQIQAELPSFQGSGMSIMELSHRSALFDQVINDAEADLRDLMQIPDNYRVLFFQGGGTLQFTAAPLNLATNHHHIGLLDSGHWASRAAEEAQRVHTQVDILGTGATNQFTALPYPDQPVNQALDYVHLTTNNTIEGTTYTKLPDTGNVPLVADMSSNFLGQPYNVQDFGMIFAGAQKNLGPAGLTIVIVRDDLIGHAKDLPSMLDYQLFADKRSMFNTPPVFAIYAAGLVLKWLKAQGGLTVMAKRNHDKAALLYDFLDQSTLFNNPVKPADRSLMNVPFVTGNPAIDARVIAGATDHNLLNLKGHRLVGGMRASLYNAMPKAGVQALVDYLADFEAIYKKENA